MDERGLSADKLAAMCGLTAKTVWHASAARRQPTFATRRLLALALGVPDEGLFDEVSSMPVMQHDEESAA